MMGDNFFIVLAVNTPSFEYMMVLWEIVFFGNIFDLNCHQR